MEESYYSTTVLLTSLPAMLTCWALSVIGNLIRDWESRGLVAEWKENFGSLDFGSKQFGNIEKVLQ